MVMEKRSSRSHALLRCVSLAVFSLALLCCSSWLQPALCIYEDQLGEYDWRRENIGLIESSLFVPSAHRAGSILAATDAGVLANIRASKIRWRVLLGRSTRVVAMILTHSSQQVVTLTEEVTSTSTLALVRGWAVTDGALLWETSLRAQPSAVAAAAELMYDANRAVITVLYRNTLYCLRAGNQAATAPEDESAAELLLWSWSALDDDETSAGSSNKAAAVLLLTSLIVPTKFAEQSTAAGVTTAADSFQRVAAGCYLTQHSDGSVLCTGDVAVVKVRTVTAVATTTDAAAAAGNEVRVDAFRSLLPASATFAPAQLRVVVASSDQFGYLPEDAVFAAVAGSGSSSSQLLIGSLGTRSTVKLAVPRHTNLPAATTDESVDAILFFDQTDGDIKPMVVACEASGVQQGGCRHFIAEQRRKGGDWSLVPFQDGSADCTATSGSFSVPIQSALTYYGSVASSAHCLSLTVAPLADDPHSNAIQQLSLRSSAMKSDGSLSSSNSGVESGALQELQLSALNWAVIAPYVIPQKGWRHSSRNGPVRYAAINRRTASQTAESIYELLLVFHSGLTVLLEGSSEQNARIVWSRNEALAHAQQALLLDPPTQLQTAATAGFPDLQQRLNLQQAKVLAYLHIVAEYVQLALSNIGVSFPLPQYLLPAESSQLSAIEAAFDGPTRRRLQKLRVFGFDKLAVCLCFSPRLAEQLGHSSSASGVPFSEAGLQLVAVDLLRAHYQGAGANALAAHDASIKWTAQLLLQPQDAAAAGDNDIAAPAQCRNRSVEELQSQHVVFVKLLSNPVPLHRQRNAHSSSSGRAQSATVLMGTAEGCTFVWNVPLVAASSEAAAESAFSSSSSPLRQLTSGAREVRYAAVIANPAAAATNGAAGAAEILGLSAGPSLATAGLDIGLPSASYSLMQRFNGESSSKSSGGVDDDLDLVAITQFNSDSSSTSSWSGDIDRSSSFLHYSNKQRGDFRVYKMNSHTPAVACSLLHGATKDSSSSARLALQQRCFTAELTASVHFGGAGAEEIVAIAYPDITDTVHSRFSILGDDSVLMKYLNPYLVVVATLATNADANAAAAVEAPEATLYLTLVDSVTGKIIARIAHGSASGPVHCLVVENHIVTTYWNTKAKRTELSSIALYEGVIDAYEFSPISSARTARGSLSSILLKSIFGSNTPGKSAQTKTAFSSVTPMAVQKTYLLPRAVTALSHTETAAGIANKNLLLGLRNGQVFSVDFRQLHPRRPLTEPSKAEKEEGLQRYSPFLSLSPISAVTHNYALPGGVATIVSAPSKLESSCLVLSFGGGAVDLHLNRVIPSQGFDLLASDFNHTLLIMILLGLAIGVMVLRKMDHNKKLSTVWA